MRSFLCAFWLAVFAVALNSPSAQAHWVWIYSDSSDAGKAHVVFAHHLAPDDNPKILDKLADMKLWIRMPEGDKAVTPTREEKLFTFALPGPNVTVGGINEYGVVAKKDAKPFRLVQVPKAVFGVDEKPWARLPIEIVPSVNGMKAKLAVVFQGKPAPKGLKVTVHPPEGSDDSDLVTDESGSVVFTAPKGGLYGFSVPHTVPDVGEFKGKKYEETRYTASLVLPIGVTTKSTDAKQLKGDPEAIKLFEAARMARAHWVGFPGFTADINVQVDEKAALGRVVVGADYKLAFTGLPKDIEEVVRRELTSVVGHRKDTSKEPTPAVVFDDAAGASPLGRAIRVVGDKNDSGYRIRDNQLTIVQRTMPKQRFVIVLQKNATNAEGKYLPESHVVQYFDNETGKLIKSDANFHSWTRVGAFDLPATSAKMSSTADTSAPHIGPVAVRFTLSNHRLSGAIDTGAR